MGKVIPFPAKKKASHEGLLAEIDGLLVKPANPLARKGANDYEFQGSKFCRELGVREIAALFREDVKKAIAAGDLPQGLKLGVRISNYSMGRSISVEIKEVPGMIVPNEARVKRDVQEPHAYHPEALLLLSEEAKALSDKLEAMLNAYNRDSSKLVEDYHNSHFYGTVKFGKVYEDQRAAFRAKYGCQ